MANDIGAAEIDVSDIDLDEATEFLRAWNRPGIGLTVFINPAALGPDPLLMGLAVVDVVRHAAKAWARVVNITESEAEARIWVGVDAERAHPTTPITEIGRRPI